MKITISVSDDFEVDPATGIRWYYATAYADPSEAIEDQTVLGSRWEAPSDLDVAYAGLGPVAPDGDTDTLERELTENGYSVKSEY
jgi:hypothetical protein